MPTRPRRLLPLLVLLAACASPGDRGGSATAAGMAGIRPEARPTRVTFQDHRSGVTLGVLNEALVSQVDYYSQPRQQLTYKVIPDLDMGALLESLAELDYFAAARVGLVRIPGARISVVVERGAQSFTLAYTTEDDAERVQQVQDCARAVQAMYNHHQGWQVMENPEGARYFQNERSRVQGGGDRQKQ